VAQRQPERFDLIRRAGGEISDRTVFDLPALAVGLPQQVGVYVFSL